MSVVASQALPVAYRILGQAKGLQSFASFDQHSYTHYFHQIEVDMPPVMEVDTQAVLFLLVELFDVLPRLLHAEQLQ